MSRRWLMAGIAAAVALAMAAPAFPDTPSTATTATTTTGPTTTTTSVTTTTTSLATTTVDASTTGAATTTATTTVAAATPPQAAPTGVTAWPNASGCPVGAVALYEPHRAPVSVGPHTAGVIGVVHLSRLVYPADGSIVSAYSVDLAHTGCTARDLRGAHARVRSLSLFDGAVTATRLQLTLGRTDRAVVSGLTTAGAHHDAAANTRIQLQRWGYLVVRPGPITVAGGVAVSAVAVHLVREHAGLPPGTVVLVALAEIPVRHVRAGGARRRQRGSATRGKHEPLTVTPPLALHQYFFPVAGPAAYVDTYGAFRSDVPGNWHHGDDIFAPLGTPVVAVASGTINRVGWEEIGGWRLWVRDDAGDEFYYAHLSGYAPTDLRSTNVSAGEVIGFVGNTGDAFTTSPHLHFEIHPRPLLHLGYDGAVDPTTYLNHWLHLARVHAPRPAHPTLPSQPVAREEAHDVWHELLAARHLIRQPQHLPVRPHFPLPRPDAPQPATRASKAAAPANTRLSRGSAGTAALLVAILSVAFLTGTLVAARHRTTNTANTSATRRLPLIRDHLRRLRRRP